MIEINGYVSDLAAARQSRAADLVLRYLGLLTELRATFGSAGPDPGTYVRVLSVLADAGRAADADAVLASMRDSDDGPAPCVACYNALLNAHAEDAGAVGCPGRRCEDVLHALEAAGPRPNAHTYAAEIDAADGAGGGGGRAGIDHARVEPERQPGGAGRAGGEGAERRGGGTGEPVYVQRRAGGVRVAVRRGGARSPGGGGGRAADGDGAAGGGGERHLLLDRHCVLLEPALGAGRQGGGALARPDEGGGHQRPVRRHDQGRIE